MLDILFALHSSLSNLMIFILRNGSRNVHVVFSSKLQATKQKVEALGKGEFVDLIASKSDISKKDCVAIIDAMRDVLADEVLNKGHEVRLRDLGTFKRKVSAPRVGRNPQTGEELQIKGSNSLGFSAASGTMNHFDSNFLPFFLFSQKILFSF